MSWLLKDGNNLKSQEEGQVSNPEGLKKNSTNFKGEKNPLGDNGKAQKCLNCQSEYNFASNCDKKKNDQGENKEDGAL